jgi:hypothetical protein
MDTLIILWLGEKYVLSQLILILFISNFFIMQISSTLDRFKNAYGLYSDIWAAVSEAIINLGVSFILGKIYGIAGIIMGTLSSMFIIAVLWKPYFLFKHGFNKNVLTYWKGLIPILVIFALSGFSVNFLVNKFFITDSSSGIIDWVLYATKITVLVLTIYGTLLFCFIKSFRVFAYRVKSLIMKRINN